MIKKWFKKYEWGNPDLKKEFHKCINLSFVFLGLMAFAMVYFCIYPKDVVPIEYKVNALFSVSLIVASLLALVFYAIKMDRIKSADKKK
jgi:hypothetical protein